MTRIDPLTDEEIGDALDFLKPTIQRLGFLPNSQRIMAHKPELLEGIKEYALDQYGPMTMTLLHAWNIKRCRDFGDIVFHLVDAGVLGKTENDSPEDFAGGYNFTEAFESPFLPPS